MMFDINFKPEQDDGGLDEEAVQSYIEQLTELFRKSVEGQQIAAQQGKIVWAGMFLEYGFDFLGILPPEMADIDVEEILFGIFPEKVSTPAKEAPNIINEMQAFWQFLEREYQLPNATDILKLFTDEAINDLTEELANPGNYGMAKSMVMEGFAQGIDITDENQLNQWMMQHSLNLAAALPSEAPPPSSLFNMRDNGDFKKQLKAEKAAKKAKRKMKQASQKKNRKRK